MRLSELLDYLPGGDAGLALLDHLQAAGEGEAGWVTELELVGRIRLHDGFDELSGAGEYLLADLQLLVPSFLSGVAGQTLLKVLAAFH